MDCEICGLLDVGFLELDLCFTGCAAFGFLESGCLYEDFRILNLWIPWRALGEAFGAVPGTPGVAAAWAHPTAKKSNHMPKQSLVREKESVCQGCTSLDNLCQHISLLS